MSDETGERDDSDVTVDDHGAIVNSIDLLIVQPGDKTRESFEAWKRAEPRLRGLE
jgi:hypothetical protein